VTKVVRVKDLRDDVKTVESVMKLAGASAWRVGLFPTRDETVAAFSVTETNLQNSFELHACWETVRWPGTRKILRSCCRTGIQFHVPIILALRRNFRNCTVACPWLSNAVKENFFYARAQGVACEHPNSYMICFGSDSAD